MIKIKKLLKSIYFLPLLLLGVACNGGTSDYASCDTSIISNNVSTSEELPPAIQPIWNEEVDEVLYKAVGEYYREIPVYTAERYVTHTLTHEGITIAKVICFTNDCLSSENTYSVILKLNGFSVSQNEENGKTYSIASKRVSSYELLCLQYDQSVMLNNGYLNIMAYLIEDRLMAWPSERLVADIGQDIPCFEAEYYQYYTQEYSNLTVAMIACYGLEDPALAIQNYLALLESSSYYSKTLESVYYCTNDEAGIEIDFYYDSDYECLILQVYKMPGSAEWPTKDLQDLFSVEIPEYHENGMRYFFGLYQDENKALVYAIDCTNASPSSEEQYKEALENSGWLKCEEYDYELWGNIYVINKDEENECQMQFYYDAEEMALIIRILIINIE